MRSVPAILIAGALAVQAASAQGARSFEVASIKPVAADSNDPMHDGPKIDGQIAEFGHMSLTDLAAYAFHVNRFQITGPKGMGASFNILAKLPEGTTRDQVPDMLVQLLVERFQMKFHKESKEFPVYALMVGPKGAKLTPEPADFSGTDPSKGLAWTMDLYARAISHHFDRPVVNETGLPGKYILTSTQVPYVTPQLREALARYQATGDITAPPAAASEPPGSAIIPILTSLGLKAEACKRQLPAIVIDRIELTATGQ